MQLLGKCSQASNGDASGLGSALVGCFVLILLLVTVSGCGTVDPPFSRITNEPAPLAPELRASFGTVGILTEPLPTDIDSAKSPRPQSPGSATQDPDAALAQAAILLAANAVSDAISQEHAPAPHSHAPEPKPAAAARRPSPVVTPGTRTIERHPSSKPAERGENNHSGGSKGHSNKDDFLGDAGAEFAGPLVVIGLAEAVNAIRAAVEAIQAAEDAVQEQEAQRSGELLRQAATEDPLQPGVETRLQELAARKNWGRLVSIPPNAMEAVKSRNDYQSFSHLDINSVLEIQISSERFVSEHLHSIIFTAQAKVFVVRVTDGQVLHAGELNYESGPHSYVDWSAHHAKRLHEEFKQARELMAEVLMEQLFGLEPTAP